MNDDTPDGIADAETSRFLAFQARVVHTNISPESLLATDYMNHFNEIVMLLEMVADMPELLDDCRVWQPKGYCDHFRDSGVADRELAIEAYDAVPRRFREPFEETIGQLNGLIARAIERLEDALASSDEETLRETASAYSRAAQRLMDRAGAIIHGTCVTLQQSEIDALLGMRNGT
ncbi:MAG: hypothetical protein HQL33_00845 [Alphaproteobacteria bacterium]|nr:hypothetical protein [Alphaproteobacteria bacterium]MBF0128513.1 hypothetical protein [Alphaproteobacteria bacterium]